MKKTYKLFCLMICAAVCVAALSGCGKQTAEQDLEPNPGQDNMLPEDQWDKAQPDGQHTGDPDSGSGQGYDMDVDANTDVFESLMAAYDQSTRVEMDASGEFEALHSDNEPPVVASDGISGDSNQETGDQETGQEPGFGAEPGIESESGPDGVPADPEPVALAPLPTVLKPEASGTQTMANANCEIDYSNSQDGYFMSRWLAAQQKIKLQSIGPSGVTYTYNLYGNDWATFPFSDGSGNYDVRVMQNVGGTKYAVAGKVSVQVDLTDEFAPFLRPNQYVDYENAVNTMAQASECCRGITDELEKVSAVYDWVVANLTYDKEKARTVKSGYLPDLDAVYENRKGICFDYASLMAAMLRSQGVPCRLVVGYAGSAYHAWISVYVDGQGWVDGVIFFDGSSWQRMDPTFASSAKGSASIMKYIGDGSNYSARYLY